ncbi:50S ribosomal protein L23 [Myxococcota bacterium]|nr:50S ribosomal protein L23 [Myxococcota bacterium]MBU1382630.1 50S ribosomal protein L23 [Myxococcota bacterium]MBU1495847.1 50S ribosomal protein L23 [Myxococcota bacterium]
MKFLEDIIIRPIMTEKAVNLQDTERKYVFEVAADANKIQVREAIEKLFNVSVQAVNIQNVMGKYVVRRVKRSRIEGKKRNWKKAIVTLSEGSEIDFFKDAM